MPSINFSIPAAAVLPLLRYCWSTRFFAGGDKRFLAVMEMAEDQIGIVDIPLILY